MTIPGFPPPHAPPSGPGARRPAAAPAASERLPSGLQVLFFAVAHQLCASVRCYPDLKRVSILKYRVLNVLRGRRRCLQRVLRWILGLGWWCQVLPGRRSIRVPACAAKLDGAFWADSYPTVSTVWVGPKKSCRKSTNRSSNSSTHLVRVWERSWKPRDTPISTSYKKYLSNFSI